MATTTAVRTFELSVVPLLRDHGDTQARHWPNRAAERIKLSQKERRRRSRPPGTFGERLLAIVENASIMPALSPHQCFLASCALPHYKQLLLVVSSQQPALLLSFSFLALHYIL